MPEGAPKSRVERKLEEIKNRPGVSFSILALELNAYASARELKERGIEEDWMKKIVESMESEYGDLSDGDLITLKLELNKLDQDKKANRI